MIKTSNFNINSNNINSDNLNIDPIELNKFRHLASFWWDINGQFKPLHAINPLRLNWIRESVGSLSGLSILDVGCGGGILSESMSREGANVTGIDLVKESIDAAKSHCSKSNICVDYIEISVEELSKTHAGHYDAVTCMEVLEHVPNPASIIQACSKLVKLGGFVFFSTLNRNIQSFLFAILGAEYILKILPIGTHSYENFIKPRELANFTRKVNLEPIAIRGIRYNPLKDSYKLSTNVSINYLLSTLKQKEL